MILGFDGVTGYAAVLDLAPAVCERKYACQKKIKSDKDLYHSEFKQIHSGMVATLTRRDVNIKLGI